MHKLPNKNIIGKLPLYYLDELYEVAEDLYCHFISDPLLWEINISSDKFPEWIDFRAIDLDTWLYIVYLLQLNIPEEVRECIEN